MAQNQGYLETILLDANRQSSEEVKGDNTTQNSIYTNKVGSGLKLNSGDKVSVHSGYISKRGASGETMEFTGKDTGKIYTLSTLVKTQHQKQINPMEYKGLNLPRDNFAQICEEYGCEEYTLEDKTYNVKDNEATFNISYYKTTNGEGYYHLPRRFDAYKSQFFNDIVEGPVLRQEWAGLMTNFDYASVPWLNGQEYSTDHTIPAGTRRALYDCFLNGMSYGAQFAGTRTIPTLALPPVPPRVHNYYKFAYANQYRRCLADMYFYQIGRKEASISGGDTGAGGSDGGKNEEDRFSLIWKKKNDNSRYTIYVKDISYNAAVLPRKWYTPDTTKTQTINTGASVDKPNKSPSRDDYASTDNADIWLEKRDPAMSEYLKYTEPKTISIEPGDYSPANVGAKLTDQLNQTDPQKYIVGAVSHTGQPTSLFNEVNDPEYVEYDTNINFSKQVVVSTYTESTCYKTFNTSTSVSVEKKCWDDFTDEHSVIPTEPGYEKSSSVNTINYLSAHQTIGVKRPELFEAGRKVAKLLGYRIVGANPDEVAEYDADFDFATMAPERLLAPAGLVVPAKDFHGLHHDTRSQGCSWKRMVNPFISKNIPIADYATAEVQTSYPWTERNLQGLKEYFDIQGKYPELFEGVSVGSQVPNLATYQVGLTANNSRFFHINYADSENTLNQNWKNSFGTDFYGQEEITDNEGAHDDNYGSNALFFYRDENRAETATGGNNENDLYYGMFIKRTYYNPYDGTDEFVIGITTRMIGGIPQAPHLDWGANGISYDFSRTIGIDPHFCAYGTSCINLYAGYLSQIIKKENPDVVGEIGYPVITGHGGVGKLATTGYPLAIAPIDINGNMPYEDNSTPPYDTAGGEWWQNQSPIHQYLKKRYVGAENPQIFFDVNESKFSFTSLHTPERVGNIINAGEEATIPIVADTNDKVYFINKRLLKKEFAPDMFPYQDLVSSNVTTTSGSGATETQNGNPSNTTYSTYYNANITPWAIMDADGGIFLEDFGINNDRDWRSSLWYMLGFTYNQFNASASNQELTRQTRINNIVTTDTIGKPTTNANVEPSDLSQYTTNIFGAELRTTQIPTLIGNFAGEIAAKDDKNDAMRNTYMPGATITQNSAQINAERLPIKMRQPYFLIKSDICADTNYLGSKDSGVSLPIIAVIAKSSADGDFFFTGAGQQEFTITNAKTLTDIRTQILNPDGSVAKLSEDTSIIYKVVKVNNASLNVAEQMLQKKK
tara:strand:- start:4792 stop:8487 length:3696 start_codon:yes stop_codon:yes gene_type:complete